MIARITIHATGKSYNLTDLDEDDKPGIVQQMMEKKGYSTFDYDCLLKTSHSGDEIPVKPKEPTYSTNYASEQRLSYLRSEMKFMLGVAQSSKVDDATMLHALKRNLETKEIQGDSLAKLRIAITKMVGKTGLYSDADLLYFLDELLKTPPPIREIMADIFARASKEGHKIAYFDLADTIHAVLRDYSPKG